MCHTKATLRVLMRSRAPRGYGGRVHLGRATRPCPVAGCRMGKQILKSQQREGERRPCGKRSSDSSRPEGRVTATGGPMSGNPWFPLIRELVHVPDKGDI